MKKIISNNSKLIVAIIILIAILSISLSSFAANTNTATVSKESVSGNKVVKVTKVKIQTISSLNVGDKKKLKVTITPSNASNKNVTWKSSNSKVATVDKNGNVKAVKEGTVKITATAKDGSGKKASVTIKVTCDHKKTESINIRNPHGSSGHEATIRCKLCKKIIKKSEVENHKFSVWKTTKKATCCDTGVKKRTCKCGYNETKKIPATKKHSTYTVYEVPSKYPDNIEYHYAMEKCSKTGKIVSEKKEKHDFVAEMEHESVRLDFGNNYIYTRKLKVCYCNVVKLDERWVQNGKDKRVPNIQFYFTNAKMRDK